jgi:uncharacterized peroxidase-related enzyme
MTRLKVIERESATGKTKELFDIIASKFGGVSNMMATMGNSPALLDGFLDFYTGLSKGVLTIRTAELIALAVSESNGCAYCVAAHKFIGKNLSKIDAESIELARKGNSNDKKTAAILKFSLSLLDKKGGVSDQEVAELRAAGVTDTELGEIIGQVALNVLTNYFNKVAHTQLDSFLTA